MADEEEEEVEHSEHMTACCLNWINVRKSTWSTFLTGHKLNLSTDEQVMTIFSSLHTFVFQPMPKQALFSTKFV